MALLRSKEAIIATVALGLVVYALSLSMLTAVSSVLQTSRSVSNTGAVKAIGVGVYWDHGCTNPVSSIDWGTFDPGASESVACYIKNEGNAPSTLSMHTSDWNPANAADSITLSWDYGGESLEADDVIQVTFTLSVAASIEGITSFSFDIVIVGSG